ncbi:MAG: hypothetical protein ACR2NV_05755 [Thermoleophilaceae bacterium]
MALPRPLLVALVGVVLAAAAFYATQSIGAPTSDPAASSDAASAGSGTARGSTGAAAKPAARPAPETDECRAACGARSPPTR